MKHILLWTVWFLMSCSPQSDGNKDKTALAYKAVPPEPSAGIAALPKDYKSASVLIKDAIIMTGTGKTLANGDILLRNGRIEDIGELEKVDADQVVDGNGMFVTPGIIDTHSHLGVYPMPGVHAHFDGNEAVRAQTAAVWAEHSVWPQDPGLWRAISGGVTTIQVLPGSANLFGGRSATLHTLPHVAVEQMKFPGAPQGLKMACGENPKRTYGSKGGPSTRMGNYAGYRKNFQKAFEYQQTWNKYQRDLSDWQANGKDSKEDPPSAPKRDHGMDTLVKVMDGEILVHIHCYRADEMSLMLNLAQDFGFKVRSFHHAVEAYKIADRLAAEQVSVSTWADWWGFKMEAFDGIPHNASLVHSAGAKAIIHSDSPEDIRFLNIEAAKAMASGRALGLKISDEQALQWITANPAWALGIDDQVGTLEKGKLADVVLWDAHPFSAYAKAEQVYILGNKVFDRSKGESPSSDFEVGLRTFALDDAQVKQQSLSTKFAELKTPETLASNDFAFTNVRILNDKGELEGPLSVVVKQGVIIDLGSQTKIPSSMKAIDGQGRLLTPGLIESLSPVGTFLVSMESQARDNHGGRGLNPGFNIVDGYDPYSVRIPLAKSQGITSMLVKPKGGLISGQGITVDLRQSTSATESYKRVMFAQIHDYKHNRGVFWLKLREAFEDAQLFKAYQKRHKLRSMSSDLSLSPIHLKALNEVLDGRIPMVLKAHRLSDILGAIRFKKEMNAKGHKLKLILNGAEESWLAVKELAKAKIPVIVIPSRQLPQSLNQLRVRDDLAKILVEGGVKTILSTDDSKIKRLRQQAGRAVSYGLSYGSAVAAITKTPAEVFEMNKRGVIAKGFRADLVLWSGDPLQPSGKVDGMWIAGELQPKGNRQISLGRRYLKKQSH